jgi:hypothetical protein
MTAKLLSGGNPQISKGDGDGPVQAYIAAVPDWRQAVCRRVDAVVTAEVPNVRKAVKWNSPLYGSPDREGWFLSLHVFTRYVKIAFFRGMQLDPVPPVASKTPNTRYLHVVGGETLDEEQFAAWVRQASRLPGEKM